MNREDRIMHEYEQRLGFEALLADLSARFVNVPSDRVDDEIDEAQRMVCDYLDLDISTLWEWESDSFEVLLLTHLHRRVDGPPVPDRMTATEFFPWCLAQLMARRTIVQDRVEDSPVEAALDLQYWRHYDIKSNLGFPLHAGSDGMLGVLSFCTTQHPIHWSDALVKRLRLVAEVLANAIARKRADQALRESEMRLGLAADAAGAGLWGLDLSTERFWLTDKAREPFGFDPDVDVSLDDVFASIHPEDREIVRRNIEDVTASGRDGRIEYRIVSPDGVTRWMESIGRLQVDAYGRNILMGATIDITERKRAEMDLQDALDEVKRLRDRLESENVYLKDQIRNVAGHGTIMGDSEPVLKMLAMARKVAPTDSSVLIMGETGTGKELLAQAIHDWSNRSHKTMIKVNCAALPAPLIESELFGREKGAYTGAMTKQVGRFELANGSTIFLDEIGDLPPDLQAKLLRVLQDGRFERLGSRTTIQTNVRVIAATNRDLAALIAEGKFREDLYHRLNVFPIRVPPLRERAADIPVLAWHFVEEFNTRMGRSVESIPARTVAWLRHYAWPGNIRELRNVIERAMILSDARSLVLDPPQPDATDASALDSMQDAERKHIRGVLERTHWRISGAGGAAEILGMRPTTLHSRMKKLGLTRPGR